MKKIFMYFSLSIVLAAYSIFAMAVSDGVVMVSMGSASIDRAGKSQPLQLGTHIIAGDRVITGRDGYVGITMRDETYITLGPSSNFLLDAFSFDSQTHDGRFLASFAKGRMRVVTGLIGRHSPRSFNVQTANSTIGIRGTSFIVEAR